MATLAPANPNLTPSDLGRSLDLEPRPITLLAVLRVFLAGISTPRIRTMRQFAESEIRLKTGPKPGRYKVSNQPYARLWFELVDSGLWPRCFATGPSQSGKTLSCFVIPILYHLFEQQEDVICLCPQADMANDKWRDDLRPAIERSRYKGLLPSSGPGSRGGRISSSNSEVNFKNGTQLKFMTGGGDDKKRAGKTVRVLVITEVDGMDESGGTSHEADKITQAEKRTASYASRKRIYGECTVTIETGRTWSEYTKGTATQIVVTCCSCGASVVPEREHLIGWDDADNVIEAQQSTHFICSKCGVLWSDAQRDAMNHTARLMHRGQSIDEETGQIVGEAAPTDTLGFRWNAFNNLFMKSGDIGGEEFKASRDDDQDNAERAMLQFVWAKPFIPDLIATIPLNALAIVSRATTSDRGIVPPGTLFLSAACDLGMRLNHWVVIAWLEGGTCHIVDYGVIKVQADLLGVELAMMKGLEEFYALCETGWRLAGGTDERRPPDKVMVDSGYQGKEDALVVYEFIRKVGLGRYWPSKGYGTGPKYAGIYNQPKAKGGDVELVKDEYHITRLASQKLYLVHINADAWKSFAHKRLTTPVGQPGAMTLFRGEPTEHLKFAKQLTAERHVKEYVEGKGFVEKWVRIQKQNHWFDALSYACVAGHLAGAKLTIYVTATVVPQSAPAPLPTPVEPERPFVRQPVAAREPDSDGGWIRKRSG